MTLQPLNAHLSVDREYSSIHLYTDAVDLQQNTVGPATTITFSAGTWTEGARSSPPSATQRTTLFGSLKIASG